jgi:phage-related baseplate assembly protein
MKKTQASSSNCFDRRGLIARLLLSVAIPIALYAFWVAPISSASAKAQDPVAPTIFQARTGEHTARPDPSGLPADSIDPRTSNEVAGQNGNALLPVIMAPTRSSFLANWSIVSGATGYRLDVSPNGSFERCVSGYQALDVGNVTSRIVSGLSPGTTYYYRVRAYDAFGASSGSNVMTATTSTTTTGLVITPTFDTSITGNPNSAAIQSMINQAVALYQPLFSDPITVHIYFRYSNTEVNGTPLPAGVLARSNFVVYSVPWTTYINALTADATTANDTSANASLPGSSLSANVVPSSAGGRAVGLNTPPAMFSNGTVGAGGPFDGIITLNSGVPYQFSRPTSGGNFDALRSTEHEMDEILGLGSRLGVTPPPTNVRPQDLFSWSAPGTRNLTANGSRYFSIDSGNTNIVGFNQNSNGDFGDWLSASCPQANPYVQNAFSCSGQFADVTVSSPEGINLDVVGYNLTAGGSTPSVLGNISTRLRVETGDNVLIGGFIITGTQAKKVIVRAIGPSLPLAGALANPVLELRNSGGGLIATNDNWRSDQEAEIIATTVPPSNDLESAIVATLPANNSNYTAIVRGVNNGTGIGVVEAYDLNQAVDSKFGNISTRGLVQTGDNVMIGGLIVLGQAPLRVIVRAIGPSLSVAGALGNPTLELRDGNGALIDANDNWRSDHEAEIIATGVPPTNDLESAIVRNLTPGNYTAIVRGVSNTTGVALVEAYGLN